MADSCIFCRIARGEVPAQMVVNNKEIVAFRDLNPQAPRSHPDHPEKAHRLAGRRIGFLLLGQMVAMAAAIARQEKIAKTGYRTVINTGKDGGQSVDHLHLHLLGGRAMTWPPG